MAAKIVRYFLSSFVLLILGEPAVAKQPGGDAFAGQFRKFAEQYCVSCHGLDVSRRSPWKHLT